MTLIASFCVGKPPVILGDVVTSTPLQGECRFDSPTLGEIVITPVIDGAYAPSDFCRKIAPISDNLCIAWSGSRLGAKALIEDIRSHFTDSEVAFEELYKFVQSVNYQEAQEVSLIGVCVNAGKVNVFRINSEYFNVPLFGPVYVAGSGSEDFKSVLGTYEGTKEELETAHPIGVAGSLGSAMLSYEALTGRTLKQRYGGGYEVVYYANGTFQTLPEATYVSWRIRTKDERQATFEMCPTVIKICYKGDDLLIRRSYGVIDAHQTPYEPATTSLFMVPSLFRGSNRIRVEIDDLPNLNSAFTFHGFLIERASGDYSVFGYGERNKKSIDFQEEDGVIKCFLSDALWTKINKIANRFWNSHIK